eukprot:TRINITY_DN5746_c0_g3_i1.p1 TRINITY_DN5746_c0_g3~~TRINITY_DN5746_c0_g3_i1.p1  ORF type:complete len:162 (-),score=27.63 TRINITY_DN5746_c0_g3_i1:129-614(-)
MELLKKAYPAFEWKKEKFGPKRKKSTQWWLRKTIEDILPAGTTILEDFMDPSFLFPSSGKAVQLDLYAPKFKLAIEYQGYQHYHDHYLFGPFLSYKHRDNEKRECCLREGITLLEIPYWWKRDKESILASIHHVRPDIVHYDGNVPSLVTEEGKAKTQGRN